VRTRSSLIRVGRFSFVSVFPCRVSCLCPITLPLASPPSKSLRGLRVSALSFDTKQLPLLRRRSLTLRPSLVKVGPSLKVIRTNIAATSGPSPWESGTYGFCGRSTSFPRSSAVWSPSLAQPCRLLRSRVFFPFTSRLATNRDSWSLSAMFLDSRRKSRGCLRSCRRVSPFSLTVSARHNFFSP